MTRTFTESVLTALLFESVLPFKAYAFSSSMIRFMIAKSLLVVLSVADAVLAVLGCELPSNRVERTLELIKQASEELEEDSK